MGIKCPKCQTDNPDTQKFCGECAMPLPSPKEIPVTKTLEKPIQELLGGTTFAGRYQIIQELGRGGMGVVYKAQDTKLKRTVALKFLPQELTHISEVKDRFMREAQAAAALDHPNICTVYEFDEAEEKPFISMAYIEGQSLKKKIDSGPLELNEALRIGIQVAEGLQEAHKKGVVHRDIKSANIIVDERGQAKIMDFGLARVTGGTLVTQEGMTMGTVAYMSPEQARGEEVDHRTDIWSLGVVLYEMIGRQRPFRSDQEQALIYAILNEEPELVATLRKDVPIGFEMILHKCLHKDARNRYKDMETLIKELNSIELGRDLEGSPSIAVLPFVNMSADPENEYFSDGLSESIINNLTQIKSFKVVARTSAFSFKGKEDDVRKIGKKLNVNKVLEGSVQKAGNRLRITAQLINVVDGYHLWSERFDRNMDDLFAIQDEISLAIVDNLKLKLIKGEKTKLVKRHTGDPEAYNFYLKGRYFYNKRTEEGFHKSIESYKQAVKKDPNFALPYAGLADTYLTLGFYELEPMLESYEKGKQEVMKALEMDDTVGEPHNSMGIIKAWYEFDWEGAEAEFKKALELSPSDVEAHHMYAHCMEGLGRFDEALAEMKRALELEPLSVILNTCLGHIFCLARRSDEAIDQLKKSIEMDPTFPLHYYWLGRAYLQKGMNKQSIEMFKKAATFPIIYTMGISALGYAYGSIGEKDKAKKNLDELLSLLDKKIVDSFYIALVYLGLDDRDKTFEWLEKAYEDRSMYITMIDTDQLFDDLREDRRFIALLKKMGLEK